MKMIDYVSSKLEPDAEVLSPPQSPVEPFVRFHPSLLASADARIGFADQINAPHIQAYGLVNKRTLAGGWGSLAAEGIYGHEIDGSRVRIERVVDPDTNGAYCWWFRVAHNDPDTAGQGTKRSEFCYSKPESRLTQGRRFVIGLAVRLGDWRRAKDNQIVWQIHGDDTVGGSPWFGQYVQGAKSSIAMRFNPNPDPKGNPKDTVHQFLFSEDYAPFQWVRWVIVVVENYRGDGLAQVYRNGVQVVDYHGRLGYNEGAASSYLKSGIYHWPSYNDWDAAVLVREAYYKGAYIMDDRADAAMMDAFLSTI